MVFDRGYTDYGWYNKLDNQGISFVTRLKRNARITVAERRTVNKKSGLTCDQTISLTGAKATACPIALRRIGYKDPETGKHYFFLTNNFHLAAKTIAELYKARWQIELFFKWIKQNLKVKSFIGTSKNAVLTQLWVAMCTYLMLGYIKFISKLGLSLQQIVRLLHLNLFERRDLFGLLKGDPPEPLVSPLQNSCVFREGLWDSSALMQNIGGGNTMVFNNAARALLREAGENLPVVTHDWWAYMVVTGCGGKVFYDSEPTLRYRQHDGNLVGMNATWVARFKRVRMLWQGRFRHWNDSNIAALRKLHDKLTPESREILERFAKARHMSLIPRLIPLKRIGIYRQTWFGTLGLIAAAVFRRI